MRHTRGRNLVHHSIICMRKYTFGRFAAGNSAHVVQANIVSRISAVIKSSDGHGSWLAHQQQTQRDQRFNTNSRQQLTVVNCWGCVWLPAEWGITPGHEGITNKIERSERTNKTEGDGACIINLNYTLKMEANDGHNDRTALSSPPLRQRYLICISCLRHPLHIVYRRDFHSFAWPASSSAWRNIRFVRDFFCTWHVKRGMLSFCSHLHLRPNRGQNNNNKNAIVRSK